MRQAASAIIDRIIAAFIVLAMAPLLMAETKNASRTLANEFSGALERAEAAKRAAEAVKLLDESRRQAEMERLSTVRAEEARRLSDKLRKAREVLATRLKQARRVAEVAYPSESVAKKVEPNLLQDAVDSRVAPRSTAEMAPSTLELAKSVR
jgi:hypothetical protein